jgi:hypothetical protein
MASSPARFSQPEFVQSFDDPFYHKTRGKTRERGKFSLKIKARCDKIREKDPLPRKASGKEVPP